MGNTLSSYSESECELPLPNQSGTIRGIQYNERSCRFANIPYAKPPTGDLRWRRPQPLDKAFSCNSTDGTSFDATNFGPLCPQPVYSKGVAKKSGYSWGEDCLQVNIWTPRVPKPDGSKKWPVIIWFHGGWFQIGDPSYEASMNPVEFVQAVDAVFVTVGYRLNVFGFLTGSALQAEGADSGAGNYGLWDQRLAMDWVYDNIATFGGDPDDILLAGRSAGAYAVQAQTLYDFRGDLESAQRDRFRRLIMYSNAIPAQPKSVRDCQEQFDELCDFFEVPKGAINSEKLNMLRAVPANELVDAIMKLQNHTFRPVTDNVFIHDGMIEYYQSGEFAAEFKRRGLRLLVSEMLNEESLYGVTNGPEPNTESLRVQISNYYAPDVTSRLLEHYSVPDSTEKKDWETAFGNIISDGQVRAPSRFLVNNLVQNGVELKDVCRYLIAYRLSFITDSVAPSSWGVTHAMDKPLWK